MTMVRSHRRRKLPAEAAGLWCGVLLVILASAANAPAQMPIHSQHAGAMPPGAIGQQRLRRGGPLPGYFQPVEIRAPQGALISTAEGAGFTTPEPGALTAGLAIGTTYRFQVTRIPKFAGAEVYPTVEVIDRLYPPPGKAWQFPIPIQLTQAELEMALRGRFITRVIYVEDPDRALAVAEDPDRQSWFEVAAGEDPLVVADRLGRPVAILRMGGRVPSRLGPDPAFLFGSPPLVRPGQQP